MEDRVRFAYIFLSLVLWAVFFITFNIDRSRYRNCTTLFLAIVSTVPALCMLAGRYTGRFLYVVFILTILALLIVPFFLVINGVMMFRREGHSMANLLSFFLGLIIGAGELATFFVFFGPLFEGRFAVLDRMLSSVSLPASVISISVIYGSVSFLMFVVYSVFLQLIPRKKDFDYVIIHGAGLLDGDRVSKLLSDRLDKAVEVYRMDPTPPYLIPSGGQGSDETVSEAEAMAGYLIQHGIPEDKIILEDKSTTTLENLKNCKEIIDAREGSKYTTLVTSNYHVYRALRYCRKIGLKCTGIGSHVAFYYWPSALIREYVAIHTEKKHALIFIAGWILTLALFFLPLFRI